jgi:hypothetical protein
MLKAADIIGQAEDQVAIADGSIRIAVGSKASDAANWVNTLGRARGALLFRFIGAASVEVPISVVLSRTAHTDSP